MNFSFRDMIKKGAKYKKGEAVTFDTCLNSHASCAACDNVSCVLNGKKKVQHGTIIYYDNVNGSYLIEVQDHNRYHVDPQWINRSRYHDEEAEKLADRFIW